MRHGLASRGVAAGVALVVLGWGCTACDDDEHASGSPPVTAKPVDRQAPQSARQLRVGLTEWTISTSSPTTRPGRVTLVVTNAGGTEHDLVVRGRSGEWETPDLAPGQQSRLVVRARPGETLRLWCSMPGHRTQGMHTTLAVGG